MCKLYIYIAQLEVTYLRIHLGSNPSLATPRRMLVGEESYWSATDKCCLQP